MEANLLLNQRNLYLTGFTLFLLICDHRFCTMLLRMFQYEEQIGELKTKYRIGLERNDEGYVSLQCIRAYAYELMYCTASGRL